MDNSQTPRDLKTYEKPTVTKLTREQAILKLRAHADRGDTGAKELLEQLFANGAGKDSEPGES